ncbi:M56 family metallopeptidase [bacterium]|nr:M56 family metallopeptidase [bacterium]
MESIIIFAGRLMRYLWPVTWQISILVVAVIVIERLFRRSATMFRYLLWCLVLARLCLPLNHIIRYVSRLFPERAAHMVHKAGELYGMTFNTIIDVPGSFLSVEHSGHSFPELFLLFISAAYCIGLLGYMVLAFISFFRTRQLLRHCVPVINSDILALFGKLTRELNIRQPVELLSIDTEKVKMPSYTGIFRPRIVLSGAIVDEWSVEDCEPILLHELYHIKRRDMALNWLQIAVQAVYFFNPFVWYANNRLRAVREELCDDGVVRHLGSGFTRYALSLLRIVEETSLDNRPGFVLIQLIGHENRIKERIRRIMKNDYKKNEILSVPSILILTALAVITVVFACVETDNITSTSSPVSKTVQQDIESPLIVKIYKNGTYEIGVCPQQRMILKESTGISWSSTIILSAGRWKRNAVPMMSLYGFMLKPSSGFIRIWTRKFVLPQKSEL